MPPRSRNSSFNQQSTCQINIRGNDEGSRKSILLWNFTCFNSHTCRIAWKEANLPRYQVIFVKRNTNHKQQSLGSWVANSRCGRYPFRGGNGIWNIRRRENRQIIVMVEKGTLKQAKLILKGKRTIFVISFIQNVKKNAVYKRQ